MGTTAENIVAALLYLAEDTTIDARGQQNRKLALTRQQTYPTATLPVVGAGAGDLHPHQGHEVRVYGTPL